MELFLCLLFVSEEEGTASPLTAAVVAELFVVVRLNNNDEEKFPLDCSESSTADGCCCGR